MKQPGIIPEILKTGEPEAWGGLKGRLYLFMQQCYLLAASFSAHQGQLRAAALTYTTVLSLVPFLAIAFSVLKGLGVQNALEPLLQQIAGDSQETIARIIGYVNNTNVKSMGAIGLVTLIMTVIALLGSIEEAFNAVWGVAETRTLQRRFSDYLSVVVVGPILLLVATSMTSSLQSQWLVQWLIQYTYLGDAILLLFRLVPYVVIWIAMVFLYLFIPNTKVRFGSALLGGILAGTAWQLAQWCYFHFQVGVANYNAIYGTLAALPIFLVWIYTSWIIVLFGLEIVRMHQLKGIATCDLLSSSAVPAAKDRLTLALLIQVCLHFQKGGDAPVATQLADELSVSVQRLEHSFLVLESAGYLVRTAGTPGGWLPARDPDEVLINDVMGLLNGTFETGNGSAPVLNLAGRIIQQGRAAARASLEGLTLHDLLKEESIKTRSAIGTDRENQS